LHGLHRAQCGDKWGGLVSLAALLLVRLVLTEDDENATKYVDKVEEEHQAVTDVVVVSASVLLDDQLSVIQDVSTEDCESKVQPYVVDQLRLEEDVHQSEEKQPGQSGRQDSSESEPLSVVTDEGAD